MKYRQTHSVEVAAAKASISRATPLAGVAFASVGRHPTASLALGYAAVAGATQATSIAVEIVKKNPGQIGFAVLPRRWVVERFFAWINRNRRLAKDFEASIKSAAAFLYATS